MNKHRIHLDEKQQMGERGDISMLQTFIVAHDYGQVMQLHRVTWWMSYCIIQKLQVQIDGPNSWDIVAYADVLST